MSDSDRLLSEAEMHRTHDVAAAVNALDARLRRVEAREGGQAADGENMCPKCGGSGMIYCGWGEAEYCECRRDWKKEYEDAEEAIGGLVDERDELRAERDAAQARVRELEAELVAVKADNENLLHERLHATEASHELAATCDALRAAMRSALGTLSHGYQWQAYETTWVLDAMTRLRAALGEEASDAE
jgi:hypothetical protein